MHPQPALQPAAKPAERRRLDQFAYRHPWRHLGQHAIESLAGKLHPLAEGRGRLTHDESLIDLGDITTPAPFDLHPDDVARLQLAKGRLLQAMIRRIQRSTDPSDHRWQA